MASGLRSWLAVCVACMCVSAASCSPTYREEQLAGAIQRICEREYRLHVSTRQVGKTLAVHLHHAGILQQVGNQIGLSPAANEVLGNVLEAVHRVTLSSNALTSFYLLLVSDPAVPGAYLTIVRYLDDVRRANANMIAPTEFFSRTILDLKFLGMPGLNLEQLILQDIQFEQFLSWQLARRIQARLTEKLQQHGGSPLEVGQCVGEYRGGEFAFTLNVTPLPDRPFDGDLIQQIFQDATSVIAQVLSDYRFEGFEAIRLIHPPTGKSLILPKTRLELFR